MNLSTSRLEPKPSSNIVTINVGGQIFQTTKQTLTLDGPFSVFSQLADSAQHGSLFVDRDPELFSILLSLLRSGNLPSRSRAVDLQDLVEEAKFYGIESVLVDSLSNPSQFQALNLEKSLVLPLNGRDSPSAIATTPNGTFHVAHGSKITSYDWSLKRKSTFLTHFSAIDSLLALSPNHAAAGATDVSGLQILDLQNGVVKKTLNWENMSRSGSTVQAIGSSPDHLFTSFESGRRNSSCIMVYDLQTLRPITEIGHRNIYWADLDSAIPATKLNWVSSYGLVMASGSHSGPSGVLGNIKLWDIRSNNVVWEIEEKVDCFSDVTVSDHLSGIFKVGVHSGEVFYADIRSLGAEKPWICLGDDKKTTNGKKEGYGCKIESHRNHVFCSKGGDVEVWSEVMMINSSKEKVFRKNLVGRATASATNRIKLMAFGGNKMFLTRNDQQPIEVWQSPSRG